MNTPKDINSITEVPAAADAAAAAVMTDHLELAGSHLALAKAAVKNEGEVPNESIYHMMVAAVHALIGIGRKVEVP